MVRFTCPAEFCQVSEQCRTRWLNSDNSSGEGDVESILQLQKTFPGQVCKNPVSIEAKTTSGIPAEHTRDSFLSYDATFGFACINEKQRDKQCEDYQVILTCPSDFCQGCRTRWFNLDSPSGRGDYETLLRLQMSYPHQVCSDPVAIEAKTVSGVPAHKTGDVFQICCVVNPETIMILLTSCSGLFQCTNTTGPQIKEFARKNAANALSVANMIMGMASILSSINGHHHAACWLVLIGYLLDFADGAVARRLNTCSALGAKLDDLGDFVTFGIATSLLLRTPDLLDNILCICYVMSVYTRLCFYSTGIPFVYRGLPCIYSSAILTSASLLSGGNMTILRVIAMIMIPFMISHNFYPHDRLLESQAWKKAVYAGGVVMVFCSSFPPVCVYYLLWSVSFVLFPTSLWSCKV
ncbi:uncharacterized protein V6R79_020968 [Siganus canaliculatus]